MPREVQFHGIHDARCPFPPFPGFPGRQNCGVIAGSVLAGDLSNDLVHVDKALSYLFPAL
jgi:hypothetical protein